MPSDDTLFTYHMNLLKAFSEFAREQAPFNTETLASNDSECLTLLEELCKTTNNGETFNTQGQQLVSRVVAGYSHLTPYLHRDLFWFFGGDCLHYMPDEEIAQYQRLDERRHELESQGQEFHWEDERAKIFGLH